MNVTALLEYLSLLLEYSNLLSATSSQHSYDNTSCKSFLVASSTLSSSLSKRESPLNSTDYSSDIQLFLKITPVAILIILTKLVANNYQINFMLA